MRIFRVQKRTVSDHLLGKKINLPSESVVFEFSQGEWAQLNLELTTWIIDCGYAIEYIDSKQLLRVYMSFLEQRPRWLAFRAVAPTSLPLPAALGLFSMIRRQPFELSGKAAFDLISFLFIDLSGAIDRGKKWQFRPELNYQVRGIPERWCIAISVPDNLVGLLIGPNGSTIARVEEFTDDIKNRISLHG
jgi:hypothetical protein